MLKLKRQRAFFKVSTYCDTVAFKADSGRRKYQHSAELMSFLDEKKRRVTPYELPTYSPDLNPTEGLWKKIKAKGTHLVYFHSFDKLMHKVAATTLCFAKQPDEVLPLFGS